MPEFSPHAWGWSSPVAPPDPELMVFPTRVGMVRLRRARLRKLVCFPHTRGDGPLRLLVRVHG